jgi:hypothetical protein
MAASRNGEISANENGMSAISISESENGVTRRNQAENNENNGINEKPQSKPAHRKWRNNESVISIEAWL